MLLHHHHHITLFLLPTPSPLANIPTILIRATLITLFRRRSTTSTIIQPPKTILNPTSITKRSLPTRSPPPLRCARNAAHLASLARHGGGFAFSGGGGAGGGCRCSSRGLGIGWGCECYCSDSFLVRWRGGRGRGCAGVFGTTEGGGCAEGHADWAGWLGGC